MDVIFRQVQVILAGSSTTGPPGNETGFMPATKTEAART